ncbi:MAG TPA: Holliday junction resolvase RuvX [Candidatus Saccharimonas sp.]|nr:Holliday junction resolvase RuvX [Candidatus Saccharimonas sp.]
MGVDYGVKRVGLAMADSDARLASPLTTVSPADLPAVIQRQGPFDVLVVGLPRSLDGTETPQTLAVRRFTDDLLDHHSHLLGSSIELVFQDEAGTSSVAEERLLESGKPFKPEDIDAEAATIILQDYLDTL